MTEEKNVQVVVQQQDNIGFICGLIGLICSILGIFVLAIVFVPIGLILGIAAIVKKSYGLGIAAVVLALIAVSLSPTLYFALGLGSFFMR